MLQLLSLISHHQLDPIQTNLSSTTWLQSGTGASRGVVKQGNCPEPGKFVLGDTIGNSLRGPINVNDNSDKEQQSPANLREVHCGP